MESWNEEIEQLRKEVELLKLQIEMSRLQVEMLQMQRKLNAPTQAKTNAATRQPYSIVKRSYIEEVNYIHQKNLNNCYGDLGGTEGGNQYYPSMRNPSDWSYSNTAPLQEKKPSIEEILASYIEAIKHVERIVESPRVQINETFENIGKHLSQIMTAIESQHQRDQVPSTAEVTPMEQHDSMYLGSEAEHNYSEMASDVLEEVEIAAAQEKETLKLIEEEDEKMEESKVIIVDDACVDEDVLTLSTKYPLESNLQESLFSHSEFDFTDLDRIKCASVLTSVQGTLMIVKAKVLETKHVKSAGELDKDGIRVPFLGENDACPMFEWMIAWIFFVVL